MSSVAKAEQIAAEFESGCSTDELKKCYSEFKRLLILGLKEDGHDMPCIPSFGKSFPPVPPQRLSCSPTDFAVTDVPTGKETGTFLAMDLGGTNIRACSVELKGDGTFDMIQSKAVVPSALQTAKTSSELFGFIADHLKRFLETHHSDHCDKEKKPLREEWFRLGFTFSFPVIQTKINAGKLMRWTKGFKIEARHI